jgi:phosphoribosylglycinamide formyltransferase 1
MTRRKSIVILCSDGASTRAIANALTNEFGPIQVIMEQSVSRLQMAKRRMRKLGILQTAGQIAFIVLVQPLLHWSAHGRIREIEASYGLSDEWPVADITQVDSVNSDAARQVLQSLKPEIVIVNGTRIISRETLDSVDAVFINTHAGITPLYRGVHGGYWALAENSPHLVGTTVHFVDKGIDTGSIIEQAFFNVTEKDNFATYPYLHTAVGIPILVEAIKSFFEGSLSAKAEQTQLGSKLRHHPTFFGYLFRRIVKGVR